MTAPSHGLFYLFYAGSGCCGAGCNYAVGVARSKSLHGPWEKNPQNPIIAGNADWKCPGHGSIVADERGRSWFLYHAYSAKSFVFTGREAMLDEVKFGTDGWPTINAGKGPSSRAAAPFENAGSGAERNFADEFDSAELKPGWNWPVSDEPRLRLQKNSLRFTDELRAICTQGCHPENGGKLAAIAVFFPNEVGLSFFILEQHGVN